MLYMLYDYKLNQPQEASVSYFTVIVGNVQKISEAEDLSEWSHALKGENRHVGAAHHDSYIIWLLSIHSQNLNSESSTDRTEITSSDW